MKVPDASLPPSDRIAHLLLALRTDEAGFATVANLSFSGARWRVAGGWPRWRGRRWTLQQHSLYSIFVARWRVRRRLTPVAREALDAAAAEARLDR